MVYYSLSRDPFCTAIAYGLRENSEPTCVQGIIYSVQCTLYSARYHVQCKHCELPCKLIGNVLVWCTVQIAMVTFTVYSVKLTVRNILLLVNTEYCRLYNVQCTMYNVQFTTQNWNAKVSVAEPVHFFRIRILLST